MKKLFPEMTDRLDTGHIICAMAYWLLCFLLFPFIMPILVVGMQKNMTALSWLEIVYCALNGSVMIGVLKERLSDCTLTIQVTPKGLGKLLETCLIALGLMAVYVFLLAPGITMCLGNDGTFTYNFFPMTEMAVAIVPVAAVGANPIFGTAVFSLLTPFAICGLFYVTGFSPFSCRKPWLGYLTVSLLLILPASFSGFWRSQPDLWIGWYLYQLPVHLLACWSYQKTDNVWAPIISLAMLNLVTSLAAL